MSGKRDQNNLSGGVGDGFQSGSLGEGYPPVLR